MLRKTNADSRETYTYNFFNGEYDEKIVIKPNENGVTEVDIERLHKLDDSEVYYNIKNIKPKKDKGQKACEEQWESRYIEEFKIKFGYEPSKDDVKAAKKEVFSSNWVASIDEICSGSNENIGLGDKFKSLADEVETEETLEIERLHEIVSSMPVSWQEIYNEVFLEGNTMVKVAKNRGVSEGAVRKTVNKIKKLIADDEILKSFFIRGTNMA